MVASGHLMSLYRARGRANRYLFRAARARGNRPPLPRCARARRRTSLLPLRRSSNGTPRVRLRAFLVAALVAAQ